MRQPGDIIAHRGEYALIYDGDRDGMALGHVRGPDGTEYPPGYVAAIAARGYWQPTTPARKSVIVIEPVLKHPGHGDQSVHGRRGGSGIEVSPRSRVEPLKSGAERTFLTDDPTVMANLTPALQDKLHSAVADSFDGLTPEAMDANLESLYSRAQTSGALEAGTQWYAHGGDVSEEIGARHGLNREQSVGVVAAMSPQREWEDNVAVAGYIMKVGRENPHVPDLTRPVTKSVMVDGKAVKVTKSAHEWVTEDMASKGMGHPDDVIGKRLSDLPPATQGLLIRHMSQAGYFTDDGKPLSFQAMNKKGAIVTKKVGWASGDSNTAKALHIARSSPQDARAVIDRELQGLKVRSFHNNLYLGTNNPHEHVTMDTHAMSAAAGRAYSSSTPQAKRFFGGPPSDAAHGMTGLYPVFAGSFRRVAAAHGIPAHQMQAVLWLQWRHETDNMPIITHTSRT